MPECKTIMSLKKGGCYGEEVYFAQEANSSCALCGNQEESVDHMFLHCEVVCSLWGRFLRLLD